jgi:hypothetical protein
MLLISASLTAGSYPLLPPLYFAASVFNCLEEAEAGAGQNLSQLQESAGKGRRL